MTTHYLLALTVPPLLLLGWALVQRAWRRHFHTADDCDDVYGDVLAGRSGCGRCGCASPCRPTENRKEKS